MQEKNYILEMKGIDKSFGSNKVLSNVDLNLKKGEVLGLIGENGAGKSTLIKILGGIYTKDAGEIYIEGEKVEMTDVVTAQKHGVRILHQELVLVPGTSIAENIFIGNTPSKNGFVDFEYINKRTKELLNEFGIKHEPTQLVGTLTIAEQQMVEVIKAIAFDTKVIVMDEPTSSLAEKECKVLFETIKDLQKRGISIIYISHRMSELNEVADRVTVLRDGKSVATKEMSNTNLDELISLMVGREISNYYVKDSVPQEEVVLSVKGLTNSYIRNVSFDLHKGEILGFSGLVGAGRTETVRAIYGIDPLVEGKIYLHGKEITLGKPANAIKNGISLVPEDRRGSGFIPEQSIKWNLVLKVLDRFIKGVSVDKKKEREIAQKQWDNLSIRAENEDTKVVELSGGNQQKVVIGCCLASDPNIIILDEPTRGVDVGAKAEIYKIINGLAKEGASVIFISSDMPEIINMCDRVIVMAEGEVTAELTGLDINQETIMKNAVLI